jgi:hypothetical protein
MIKFIHKKRKKQVLLLIGIIGVLLLVYTKMNYKPLDEESNVPLSGETNTFIRGNLYSLDFRSKDFAGIMYMYCYETQYQWVFTDSFEEENVCAGIEGKDKSLFNKINMEARLKESTTKDMFNKLNAEYGVTVTQDTNSYGLVTMEIPYQVGYEYNSYTLAKKYFDTGYFDIVRPTMTVGIGEEY